MSPPPMNGSAQSPAAAKGEPETHTKQVQAPEHKGASVLVPPPPCAQPGEVLLGGHCPRLGGKFWDPWVEAEAPLDGK